MTQHNPKADTQSPAEALRQQAYNFSVRWGIEEKLTHQFETELMELVTAYSATVEREALIEGAKKPILSYDLTTAIAVKALCEDRIAALQGPQEQNDTSASS